MAKPFRVPRNKIVRAGEVEKAIRQSERKRAGAAAILVLLDTDPDDCPVGISSMLVERAKSATRLPVAVVMAQLEYEAWFLGFKQSLRGACGIREDAESLARAETIRGAKGRLVRNMQSGFTYKEKIDQPKLSAKLDLDECARNCPSFRKLLRDVEFLVSQIHNE